MSVLEEWRDVSGVDGEEEETLVREAAAVNVVNHNVVLMPRCTRLGNPASGGTVDLDPLHPIAVTGPEREGEGKVVGDLAVEKDAGLGYRRTGEEELDELGEGVDVDGTADADGGGKEAEEGVGSDCADGEEKDCGQEGGQLTFTRSI